MRALDPHPEALSMIERLSLRRHDEGGWFAETYRADLTVDCPDRDGLRRPTLTVIHYLVERSAPRCLLHRNLSDIVHFHQGGGVLRYLTLSESGLEEHLLGPGHLSQLTVPGGVWKATELVEGPWALIGEAVSPGFDYRDRRLADPTEIARTFPHQVERLAPFLPSDHG